ncbi:MAG: transposase [Bryobacteraceae bacterium]
MPEYHRHLPHFHPEAVLLFLTWRLHGSLPATYRLPTLQTPAQLFTAKDRFLDQRTTGPLWLSHPPIADLVATTIRRGEFERHFYELEAWVVMPNHVHILIHPLVAGPVLMRWLKGSTARAANVILNRTGQRFWQDESYDHYLRRNDKVGRTIAYIEQNPVKAGLATAAEQWPWSSASRRKGGTGVSACRPAGPNACPTVRD